MREWGGEVEIRREGKGTAWCVNNKDWADRRSSKRR